MTFILANKRDTTLIASQFKAKHFMSSVNILTDSRIPEGALVLSDFGLG